MANEETIELLPCPFCGGEAKLRVSWGGHAPRAACQKCGAEGVYGETIIEAAEKWNTRTPDVAAEREACAQVAEQNWNQKTANMIRARGENT